nr:MAG TPA: hypothetical protein [Bacteriophage sp.]
MYPYRLKKIKEGDGFPHLRLYITGILKSLMIIKTSCKIVCSIKKD